MNNRIKIYTDGACLGNQSTENTGGYGAIIFRLGEQPLTLNGGYKNTTNNRMEIQAIIGALHWAFQSGCKDIEIITDSMYVVGTMTMNWKRKKNIDLWEKIDIISKELNITWTHVKGHNGNKYNELCDSLAVEATKTIIKND